MKNRLLSAILGMAAALGPVSANAQNASNDGWEHGPVGDGLTCYLSRPTTAEVVVSIQTVPGNGEYRLAFASRKWDSLAPRANQRVPIELLFSTPQGDVRITDSDALVIAVMDGYEGIVGIWLGAEAEALRKVLNRATNVTLIAQGTEIGTYSLSGMAAGLPGLDRCNAGLSTPQVTPGK